MKKKVSGFKYIGSFQRILGKEKPIYMITSVRVLSPKKGQDPGDSRLQKDRRCWGWVATLKEAKHAVAINAGDMHECSYNYVLIEEVPPGICIEAKIVSWYVFTGKYPQGRAWKRCKTPVWVGGTINWSIG